MRRDNVFWGAVLIVIGAVMLLDRYLAVNLWARLWPLLLVAAGLKMLWNASHRRDQPLAVESLPVPLEGAKRARLTLKHGLGELRLSAGDDPDLLLSGTFAGGVKCVRDRSSDTLHVKIQPSTETLPGMGVWPGFMGRRGDGLAWNLEVNPEIPLTLEAEGGLSSTFYDLSELNVKSFRLKGGLASAAVDLPAAAGHTRVRIETGLASVRLKVPEGVAARIQTSGGLASADVDRNRFPLQNGAYISTDYEEAANRLEIEVEMGLGSLVIR